MLEVVAQRTCAVDLQLVLGIQHFEAVVELAAELFRRGEDDRSVALRRLARIVQANESPCTNMLFSIGMP